jgi:hypothetical protein
MLRRSKVTARGSPPTTPHIRSVGLPSFGGRGYESDSMTKATSPLRRPHATHWQLSPTTSIRRTATSKMSKVFTLPVDCFSSHRDIPTKGRTRTSSISSVSSQSASTSWRESLMAKPRVDAPWASFQASSRGGSSAAEPNAYFDEDPHSSQMSCGGGRSRKSSFTGKPNVHFLRQRTSIHSFISDTTIIREIREQVLQKCAQRSQCFDCAYEAGPTLRRSLAVDSIFDPEASVTSSVAFRSGF